MQTYFWSFGPFANLVSSFRESSQHVRKTCAWIKHPPDESDVFVDYLVPENLVGWVSFICRWFSNIFPWNIGTSQPASLESQGMIPRGYATKHSPKVYCRICPSIRLFLVYRLGLVVSMGFIMSYHHFMCGFSRVRCSTWILDGKQGCNNRSGNNPTFDGRISVIHGLNP